MNDIKEKLEKIGLARNEVKVYTTLIKIGSSKAGRIAKEASLDRSSCYNALKRLLEKGLVSYVVVGKVKIFTATNPKKIIDYLREKIEIAQEAVPLLEAEYKQTKSKEQVTLFYGNKGVRTVLQEMVREADENLVFGSEGQLEERMPYYTQQLVRQIEERGIKIRSIVRGGRKEQSSKTTTVRYFPKDVVSPVVTNIWKNKIAIIIWSDPPEAVLIENENAAKAYRNYFEFMWKHAIRKKNTSPKNESFKKR